MNDGRMNQHPEVHEIAAYADGVVSEEVRARLQAHLATCAECRMELADVLHIVGSLPHAQRMTRRVWIPAAAAAAVLLVAWPHDRDESIGPLHREAAVTTTVSPRAIAPVGSVDSATTLVWSSVPYADSYRVRLFDREGTVLWERETADTSAPPQGSVMLRAGLAYYWRVEARTGFDRVAESDLTEFVIRQIAPP